MGHYIYTHTNTSLTTLKEVLSDPTLITVGYKVLLKRGYTESQIYEKFLSYNPIEGGKNNKDIIYDYIQKKKLTDKYILSTLSAENYPIFPGMKLWCEDVYTDISVLSVTGENVELEERDFKSFISKELLELISDKKYIPSVKYKNLNNQSITEQYPVIEVLIWIRSINKLINVTKFVDMINTNVSKQGGSFNLSLAPVVVRNDDNKSAFRDIALKNLNIIGSDSFITQTDLYDSDGNRNRLFFHELIGVNDLVLIKFEELELKSESRNIEQIDVDFSNIPNQIYDMIGLVDSNVLSTSPQGGDIKIDIQGRDVMKLLQEDGSYFLPIMMIEGADSFFGNQKDNDKVIQRLFLQDEYKLQLFTQVFRPIDFTLKFLINQCSNIGIIPDNLFNSYRNEKLSKVYRITDKDKKTVGLKNQKGLWQILKLNVDSQLDQRRLADASLSQPDGSIQEQFSKVCQEPLVEFFGDTYGDQYVINVRKPPFDGKTIVNWIDNEAVYNTGLIGEEKSKKPLKQGEKDFIITIYDEDIIYEILSFNEDEIYTYYQIDSCFVNPSGNSEMILNWIPICYFKQYVEIWGMKKFFLSDIYMGYNLIKDKAITNNDNWNYNTLIRSVVEDLSYCIDINAYMPFIRKGSITIKGDRRIKRGTWVYLDGTGEIYYVDSVSNSASTSTSSIDRTTTLTLTRGMVRKYCKDVVRDSSTSEKESSFTAPWLGDVSERTELLFGNKNDISYFNIINTEAVREKIFEISKQKKNSNIKSIYQVNQDVFDFFLNREQFRNRK